MKYHPAPVLYACCAVFLACTTVFATPTAPRPPMEAAEAISPAGPGERASPPVLSDQGLAPLVTTQLGHNPFADLSQASAPGVKAKALWNAPPAPQADRAPVYNPAPLALFGICLLGLAGIGRRKLNEKRAL